MKSRAQSRLPNINKCIDSKCCNLRGIILQICLPSWSEVTRKTNSLCLRSIFQWKASIKNPNLPVRKLLGSITFESTKVPLHLTWHPKGDTLLVQGTKFFETYNCVSTKQTLQRQFAQEFDDQIQCCRWISTVTLVV